MALYPIQKKIWNKENPCGKPGINGGQFPKDRLFGVNCYGIKPANKTNKNESKYYCNPYNDNVRTKTTKNRNYSFNEIKDNKDKISILPFSKGKWTEY